MSTFPQTIEEHQPRSECVLIVEDEAPSRHFMALLLRARGIRSYEAASAEDAIHFLEEGKHPLPSHAVVDVDLPGMGGLDLVRRMAETVPQVQAVLVTGADSRLVEAFRLSYPVPYFPKPVDVEGFLSTMVEMVKDQRPM